MHSEAQSQCQLHQPGLVLLGGDNAEEIVRRVDGGLIVDSPGGENCTRLKMLKNSTLKSRPTRSVICVRFTTEKS